MLRFSGKKLPSDEMKILKMAARFTLDRHVSAHKQRKISITVCLEDSPSGGWDGECSYVGLVRNKRVFDIRIRPFALINKRAKKPLVRLKNVIEVLMHELIHVKQYVNNELFDYVNGDTKYDGRVYPLNENESYDEYWNSPWEIEAYGRVVGTFEMFLRHHGPEIDALYKKRRLRSDEQG
jgi:hypothetical protein